MYEENAAKPTNGNIYITDSHVGAIQSGSSNIANIQQINNPRIAGIIELLEQSKSELANLELAKKITAIDAMDDLKAEVQSANPKPSKIKAYATIALAAAAGIASVGSAIATVLQYFGIPPEEITKLIHL